MLIYEFSIFFTRNVSINPLPLAEILSFKGRSVLNIDLGQIFIIIAIFLLIRKLIKNR